MRELVSLTCPSGFLSLGERVWRKN